MSLPGSGHGDGVRIKSDWIVITFTMWPECRELFNGNIYSICDTLHQCGNAVMRLLRYRNIAVISFCADLLVICSGSCVTPRVLHPSELRYGVSAKKWKVRQCFMGIVEQFSLEGLEVVMPARRYQLTAITTASASRLRSATGAVAPFLTLSMYRQERSHCYVRFRPGEGLQNSCRTSPNKPTRRSLQTRKETAGSRCGIAVGLLEVLMRAMVRLRERR